MALPVLGAAIAGVAVSELLSGPLSSALSTVIPHENVTMRAALRMVANGALDAATFEQLEAVRRLQPEDRAVIVAYAHDLQNNFNQLSVRALQKPFLKEGIDIFKTLDDYDKAEFLGGLDDALARLKATEAELVRLDRAERDAWLREELAYNSVLVNIVEARLKATAVIA